MNIICRNYFGVNIFFWDSLSSNKMISPFYVPNISHTCACDEVYV